MYAKVHTLEWCLFVYCFWACSAVFRHFLCFEMPHVMLNRSSNVEKLPFFQNFMRYGCIHRHLVFELYTLTNYYRETEHLDFYFLRLKIFRHVL